MKTKNKKALCEHCNKAQGKKYTQKKSVGEVFEVGGDWVCNECYKKSKQ